MPRRDWDEFEINDFEGIASGSRKPKQNQAITLENFDLREISGDLVLRQGYEKLFACPTHAKLSSVSNLKFENIYVTDIQTDRDVSVLIQKAVLSHQSTSGLSSTTPYLPIWARPYTDKIRTVYGSASTLTTITTNYTATLNQYAGYWCVLRSTDDGKKSYFRKIISNTAGSNSVFTVEAFPELVGAGDVDIYGWVDAWRCLNEPIYTTIKSILAHDDDGLPCKAYMRINMDTEIDENYLVQWSIYNTTKKEYAFVIGNATGTPYEVDVVISKFSNNWQVNDEVLLIRNYLPIDYIQSMGLSSSSVDIQLHKILNDLRIGFGSGQGKIGLAVGHRMKTLQIDSVDTSVVILDVKQYTQYDQSVELLSLHGYTSADIGTVVLLSSDGYVFKAVTIASIINGYKFTVVEDLFEDFPYGFCKTIYLPNLSFLYTQRQLSLYFGLELSQYAPIPINQYVKGFKSNFVGTPLKRYFYYITAVVDGYQEFIATSGSFDASMATPISYTLDLDYSVIDKRISAIRIYLSENALSATEAITSYYFQKELSIGRDYFQQCSVSNLFGIYLPTGFIRQTDTLSYVITDGELPDILGYTPTTDYAYSWDKAIISNGKVFALNPQLLSNYYKNKILVSPVSGAGAFQYDVLVPDQATYLDFETFDGNNVQGMLLMPNLDYFLLRESSVQGIDSQTGVTRFTDILGLTGKNAYGSGGNKFMFLSDVDIYIGNSSEIKNVSDGTIRDKYRALSLTDRQTSFLTYELRDNSPRIAFNAGATEMILSPRGWMTAKRNAMPVNYVQSSDNKIWFIGGTNIYKDSDQTLDDTTPITATWKSAPIDISLLGSDIKANTRFVLGKVWLKYKSSVSVTINIYLDGSSTPFQIITAPSNLTDDDFYSAKIQIGVNSLYFQVELVAVTTATNSSCRIMACGFLWKPASVGFRG